jgi:hypothetical protein
MSERSAEGFVFGRTGPPTSIFLGLEFLSIFRIAEGVVVGARVDMRKIRCMGCRIQRVTSIGHGLGARRCWREQRGGFTDVLGRWRQRTSADAKTTAGGADTARLGDGIAQKEVCRSSSDGRSGKRNRHGWWRTRTLQNLVAQRGS